MNTTVPSTTAPPVTGQAVYAFAALCSLADTEVLDQVTPREDADLLMQVLFPTWSREQRDLLWDRGRIDAAALAQADRSETYRWPLCDMTPPDPKLRVQYAAFVCDLELAVESWIRQAASR